MKIITVPGIHSIGEGSTDIIGAKMRAKGYQILNLDQPVRSAWGARWHAEDDATDIIDIANDGDAVIAHSYGGLKTAIANRFVNFSAIFLFRPAMSRWHQFPAYQDTTVFCIYSTQDYTIWLGSLALYHPFGLAGAKGFKDPFVRNIKSVGPHSHDFTPGNVDHWADFTEKALKYIERTT